MRLSPEKYKEIASILAIRTHTPLATFYEGIMNAQCWKDTIEQALICMNDKTQYWLTLSLLNESHPAHLPDTHEITSSFQEFFSDFSDRFEYNQSQQEPSKDDICK